MIDSKIPGLVFLENKIVGDQRGALAEMLQKGTGHELAPQIGNLYASIATGRYVPRAAHYHHKLCENQFTLTGTALWVFKDMREGSNGVTQAIIAGAKAPEDAHGIQVCTMDQGFMLHTHVRPEIYHIFYPLTDEPVTVVCASSLPHDPEDYIRPADTEVPGVREYIERFISVIERSFP